MMKAKRFMANTPIKRDANSKWAKVFLNDTIKLAKFQAQIAKGGYNRRLFTKINRTSTPARLRSRPNFYHKYVTQSKRGTPVRSKKSMGNNGSAWKQENDVWNMFQQAITQSLQAKHKLTLPNKDFAVRSSCDNVRLIRNREELNEQVLVSSNGIKSRVGDFVDPNECTENMVFKVRYRLVPVIEGITVVNNAMETSYHFAEDDVDINNNNNENNDNDNNNNHIEADSSVTLSSDTSMSVITSMDESSECDCGCNFKTGLSMKDLFGDSSEDETITNTSCSTWKYSDFQNDISPEAASTFIAEDKENIPFIAAPRKAQHSQSVTFSDSPMPSFAKRSPEPCECEPDVQDIMEMMEMCDHLRNQLRDAISKVDKIAAICGTLVRKRAEVSDFTLSGFDFLSFGDSTSS